MATANDLTTEYQRSTAEWIMLLLALIVFFNEASIVWNSTGWDERVPHMTIILWVIIWFAEWRGRPTLFRYGQLVALRNVRRWSEEQRGESR